MENRDRMDKDGMDKDEKDKDGERRKPIGVG